MTKSNDFFHVAHALYRLMNQKAEAAFQDIGLTPSDAYLIMAVNEKMNIQPTEISDKILLAPSTITRMVDKLEKRRLLDRSREGKYSYIRTTSKGADLYPIIQQIWTKMNTDYEAILGKELVGQLTNELNGVNDKIRI